MNSQEIFDAVARHLLAQGQKSFRRTGGRRCAYRGVDGLKCAVGCLIPDGLYSAELEGKGIRHEDVQEVLPFDVTGSRLRLLVDLQGIHDHRWISEWRRELWDLASHLGLDDGVVR